MTKKSERTSLLCPHCRKLISSDEPACPYCGLSSPGSRLRTNFLSNFFRGGTDIVKLIIYTNVVFYIAGLIISPESLGFSGSLLHFLSPSMNSLFSLGATGSVPVAGYGRWWTLISASFLHGGILHIFFNMAALSQLGPFILHEFGFNRFVIIYTATGITGFFLSVAAGVPFTIGASASICGLIGAIIYYGKSRGGFYGEMIYKQAMGWVIGLVLFGLLIPGINNWAHGGGVISGILLGMALGYEDRKKDGAINHTLAMVCIAATIAALGWGIIQTVLLIFR